MEVIVCMHMGSSDDFNRGGGPKLKMTYANSVFINKRSSLLLRSTLWLLQRENQRLIKVHSDAIHQNAQ